MCTTYFACNGAAMPGAPDHDDDITDDEWALIEAMADRVMERERGLHGDFEIVGCPAW